MGFEGGMRRLGFPNIEFPQCPKWAKWSGEIYWSDTRSWKQQHLQLTARKKPFSDLTGHLQTSQCCSGI